MRKPSRIAIDPHTLRNALRCTDPACPCRLPGERVHCPVHHGPPSLAVAPSDDASPLTPTPRSLVKEAVRLP